MCSHQLIHVDEVHAEESSQKNERGSQGRDERQRVQCFVHKVCLLVGHKLPHPTISSYQMSDLLVMKMPGTLKTGEMSLRLGYISGKLHQN
jgi:hypothetical protein